MRRMILYSSRPLRLSRLSVNDFSPEQLLLTKWRTAIARDDRQRMDRIRQNAENLFKPREQTTRPDAPISAPDAVPAEQQLRRQPRIFAIPPQLPTSATKGEVSFDQTKCSDGRRPRVMPAKYR